MMRTVDVAVCSRKRQLQGAIAEASVQSQNRRRRDLASRCAAAGIYGVTRYMLVLCLVFCVQIHVHLASKHHIHQEAALSFLRKVLS